MPSRIIREGILTSERVDRLSPKAEIFYRRLMSVVDDHGRFDARPAVLIAACYPLRVGSICAADVEHMLSECAADDTHLLLIYELAGKRYLQINDFRQQLRSKRSKYPDPNDPNAKHVPSMCLADAQHLYTYTESESEANSESESESEANSEGGATAPTAPAHLQPLPVTDSPFDRWRNIFVGPVEATAWREFGMRVQSPEDIERILGNTRLWMATSRYRDGFHGAIAFLRSEVWKEPPKQPATGLSKRDQIRAEYIKNYGDK